MDSDAEQLAVWLTKTGKIVENWRRVLICSLAHEEGLDRLEEFLKDHPETGITRENIPDAKGEAKLDKVAKDVQELTKDLVALWESAPPQRTMDAR